MTSDCYILKMNFKLLEERLLGFSLRITMVTDERAFSQSDGAPRVRCADGHILYTDNDKGTLLCGRCTFSNAT